jgi:hypothetical protein
MTREDIAAFSPNVLLLDGFGDDVTMFDDAILGISTPSGPYTRSAKSSTSW